MQSHIKPIGVHVHAWERRWRDSTTELQTCTRCGTRRIVNANDPIHAAVPSPNQWQRRWLDGGELPARVGSAA